MPRILLYTNEWSASLLVYVPISYEYVCVSHMSDILFAVVLEPLSVTTRRSIAAIGLSWGFLIVAIVIPLMPGVLNLSRWRLLISFRTSPSSS